ncbi:MAG: MFS transporter, partial [Promethearchaeota archaeon]
MSDETSNMNQGTVPKAAIKTKDKSSRIQFLEIILFFPLVLLTSSDAAILTANQVLIMADLNASIVDFGWLVGIGILNQGIFTFIFGYLADKYPRKWLLISGGGIWALGVFLMLISNSVPVLYIGRIVGTTGLGAISPVTFSLLSDMFPSEKRSNSFAWWGIATLIGGLFGASLGLVFNKIPFEQIVGWDSWDLETKMDYLRVVYPGLISNWRQSYGLVSFLGLAFTLLCFFVKEPKRGAKDKQFEEILSDDELKYTYKIKRSDLKYIFTRKTNFWLIFNFLDVVVSGFFLANILLLINSEMQFDFNEASSLGQLALFLIPALVLGIFGQFYFAKLGDKRVKKGDPTGRVKIAIMGGILHIPFFVAAFLFAPNRASSTFFMGALKVPEWGFWLLMLVMGLILGVGLMWSFAIAPNWYASLIDVNLPEHRGTMLATAAFLDTIGRSFGSIVGGLIINYFDSSGSLFPVSMSIIWMTIIFGGISGLMWIPIYKYCNYDFAEVQRIMDE